MRTAKVNNTKLEVSKSESEKIKLISSLKSLYARQSYFNSWYNEAPTPQAKERRKQVGLALNLQVE